MNKFNFHLFTNLFYLDLPDRGVNYLNPMAFTKMTSVTR